MCDSERECEDSSNWSHEGFRKYLATKHPAKGSMCLAHDWNAKSQYRWRQLCFTSSSRVRTSRETFCFTKLYYLIHTFWTHTIYTLITHKCKGKLLREKPSKNTWELKSTHLFVEFPHLLPLHFHTIERLIVQILTTPFESVK